MDEHTLWEILAILSKWKSSFSGTDDTVPDANSNTISDNALWLLIVDNVNDYEQRMRFGQGMDGTYEDPANFFIFVYVFCKLCESDLNTINHDELWEKFNEFQRLLRLILQARATGKTIPDFNIFDMNKYTELIENFISRTNP